MIERDKYTEYALDVVNDKITASRYVKMSCERFLKWFERDDIEFRRDKVDKVVTFIYRLKHYMGASTDKPFVLTNWQFFIIENLFGWYYRGTKKRVIKNAYIEVGRKAGKTTLLSAIALYALMADGESGAEVDCIANTRQQAKILFDTASYLAETLDPKHKYIKPFRDKIKFATTKSHIQVLSSDAKTLDGFNASLFVEDELHEAKDSRLYDVMKSSQGMRQNPLAVCITSAGFNKYSFCYQMRKTCIEILEGTKTDDTQFSAIYCLDEEDDWKNETVWAKANPNVGITVSYDYLREQVTQATNNTALEVGVRTKNFGQWVDSEDIWISDDDINSVSDTINLSNFVDAVGYIGVDLSKVSDLTAVSLMIPYEGKFYFKNKYYLPETALEGNSNVSKYQQWVKDGYLTITKGRTTNYDYIINDIKKWNEVIPIQIVGYDAYNAKQWSNDMTNEGFNMKAFSQSLANFNFPTKELERLIKNGDVVIEENDLTKFCFKNVVIIEDHAENFKPTKETNQNKIDGVIAMIEALGVYLSEPIYNNDFIPLRT